MTQEEKIQQLNVLVENVRKALTAAMEFADEHSVAFHFSLDNWSHQKYYGEGWKENLDNRLDLDANEIYALEYPDEVDIVLEGWVSSSDWC